MNNEIATIPNLAKYNGVADLVAVRRDAQKYPRINATPFDEAVAKMTPIIHAAFLYRGQDASELTIRFIANALVSEILTDTKCGLATLSWVEIGMAIRNAVLGEAREFYGVSVATLYGALVDYAKTDGHAADVKAAQKPLNPISK